MCGGQETATQSAESTKPGNDKPSALLMVSVGQKFGEVCHGSRLSFHRHMWAGVAWLMGGLRVVRNSHRKCWGKASLSDLSLERV